MRLGLLGYPITHSLSPKLYQDFLGSELTSYDLFSCPTSHDIPPLNFFAEKLDGLNITSPYKTHFFRDVKIESELVRKIGAINTIAFGTDVAMATNTDVLAVEEILKNYKNDHGKLFLIILGSGVMAQLTTLVARQLEIDFCQFSRKTNPDLATLELEKYRQSAHQNIIINACSREFVFRGTVEHTDIFWDYNYSFLPHQNSLPQQVKAYHDGRKMLELQARAAIRFWKEVTPKLK